MNLWKLQSFKKELPESVTIVASTKYVNCQEMQKYYEAGFTDFGENRVNDFLKKYEELHNLNITWHFIGHLQRNKAKLILDKIKYLHSLDDIRLLPYIEKYANGILQCFIEVNLSGEENKNGLNQSELPSFISECLKYSKVKIIGLMTMSALNASSEEIAQQFKLLKDLTTQYQAQFKLPYFKECSMGMSNDYQIALKNGATYIRIGKILKEILDDNI